MKNTPQPASASERSGRWPHGSRKVRTVKLDPADIQMAEEVGDGQFSEGVRRIFSTYRHMMAPKKEPGA